MPAKMADSCIDTVLRRLYDVNNARRVHISRLGDLTYISSAGLVALHSTVLIMRGQKPPDPESGWNIFHTISNNVEAQTGPDPNVRLLA